MNMKIQMNIDYEAEHGHEHECLHTSCSHGPHIATCAGRSLVSGAVILMNQNDLSLYEKVKAWPVAVLPLPVESTF